MHRTGFMALTDYFSRCVVISMIEFSHTHTSPFSFQERCVCLTNTLWRQRGRSDRASRITIRINQRYAAAQILFLDFTATNCSPKLDRTRDRVTVPYWIWLDWIWIPVPYWISCEEPCVISAASEWRSRLSSPIRDKIYNVVIGTTLFTCSTVLGDLR